MGALIAKNPHNALAPLASQVISTTVRMYLNAAAIRTSPRLLRNLHWLQQLDQRVSSRMPQGAIGMGQNPSPSEVDEDEAYSELLGWRTRLIRRVRQVPARDQLPNAFAEGYAAGVGSIVPTISTVPQNTQHQDFDALFPSLATTAAVPPTSQAQGSATLGSGDGGELSFEQLVSLTDCLEAV